MKVISALASPAQDEVIRAILEARGEWDPPWLRARAPPAIAATPAPLECAENSSHYERDDQSGESGGFSDDFDDSLDLDQTFADEREL